MNPMVTTPSGRGVSVTFSVTFDYQRYYDEAELAAAAPELLARLRGASTLEGAFEITADAGPSVKIVDELAPWAQNLCLRAVPALAMAQPTRIQYFSQSGFLDLTPQGDAVVLSGDLTPSLTVPRMALAHALLGCGQRFIAFAAAVKGADADYMANLDYLRRFEEPAKQALASAQEDGA